MKNRLQDLNDHLFAELERLSDEDLKGDDLDREIKRASALVDVAQTAVNNAELVLEGHKLMAEYQGLFKNGIPMLSGPDEVKSEVKKPR
jgi:hypothetical protein